MKIKKAPRFAGLKASSPYASAAAKAASVQRGTKPELLLRKSLWHLGYRYRANRRDLLGCPDIVFNHQRVVVFVDGDFWHGRKWAQRRAKLSTGSNASYWIEKIEANIARDRRQATELRASGWVVIRVWESEILRSLDVAVDRVLRALSTNFPSKLSM